MIEVRTKDKIFVAIIVPMVIAASIIYFARQPAARALAALRAESAQLPDVQMFPLEKRQLASRLEEAKRQLAAVRAERLPAPRVKGEPTASMAARQAAALAVFTVAGARIVQAEPVKDAAMEDGADRALVRGGSSLQATGVCPAPEAVRVTVEAPYPQLVCALRKFAAELYAVVPESISLTTVGAVCRWEVTLWL